MPFAAVTNIDLSAVGAYPADPQVTLPFEPDGWILQALTGAGDAVVRVSFDGDVDHLELREGTPTGALNIPTHATRLWAKRVSGTNPTTLNVAASTDV